jgi:hypothetical protein
MDALPSNELLVKLKEDALRALGAEERRAGDFMTAWRITIRFCGRIAGCEKWARSTDEHGSIRMRANAGALRGFARLVR